MESVVGKRIKNSRIHKGLSLQNVADYVGVSKQMISKYENGETLPNSGKIILLSQLFGQKPDYFFRKSEVEIGEINFRKKSTFGIKKINALKEEVRLHIENYIYVENTLNLNVNFKNPLLSFSIGEDKDIVRAASFLKEKWEIGKDAIYNVIDLLEEKHIKVIEVEEETNKFDGLATIVDDKYYIVVVNKNFPVERKRFTLLHELGHLLLNIKEFEEKQQEKFCNLFASEMLLSSENLLMEFGHKRSQITFEETINIQKKYGISFTAIVYKLGENAVVSKSRIENFYKRINSKKELKKIVENSYYKGVENSNRYENLVLRAVTEEMISYSKASSLLQMHLSDLKNKLNYNIG